MLFLRALELVFMALLFLFVVTQVIIPMVKNLPLFPILRHSNPRLNKLSRTLERAADDFEAAKLEDEITQVEQKSKNVRDSW